MLPIELGGRGLVLGLRHPAIMGTDVFAYKPSPQSISIYFYTCHFLCSGQWPAGPMLIFDSGFRIPLHIYLMSNPIFIHQVCTKLGWKSKGSEWDILPLVVSANGHDPDYFDYPPELILEVPLSHPK